MVTRKDLLRAMDAEVAAMRSAVSFALTSRDLEPRAAFCKHFPTAEASVGESNAVALAMLSVFTFRVEDTDLDRLRVLGILYTTINLQLSSFKLFMLGHTVASGSLFRQVIEGVSLAFLCSVRSLGYLKRFEAGHYSASGAVQDLKKRARDVNVRKAAMQVLLDAYGFYHKYAHLTKLTIAASADFSRGGVSQIGAHFDAGKVSEYGKEIRGRTKFAQRMPNAVYGVCRNIASW